MQGVVLIADPDGEARQAYEIALARAGLSVVSAADGVTALRMADRLVPDDLLTEILLPNLDGFHLAKRLRSQPRTRHMGIIAVTSYSEGDLKQRAFESGIDRVLRKPRPMHDVVRELRATRRRSGALGRASAILRDEVDSEFYRARDLRERAQDLIARSREVSAEISRAMGRDRFPIDDEMILQADGARDVMMVDRPRGEQLFDVLFERYGHHGLLHYKRGEAYRAIGRRKLAHVEFVRATEVLPDGVWRERARFAAMRTRSHHD